MNIKIQVPDVAWMDELDAREKAQVLHAIDYALNHASAGAPSHGQFLLIAKLARMLGERKPTEAR